LDSQSLLEEKWVFVRKILESKHPEPIDSMERLLAYLRLKKIPVIIASASPGWYIEMLLDKKISGTKTDAGMLFRHTPLKYYFQENFLSAEDVSRPKPAPDVFLGAAKRLKVNPKRCLVIGDGKSDVYGGTAAGMDVIFLGEADQKIYEMSKVLSFSKSTDLVFYLIKQSNLF
jgi:beta-phosphoglucomutase-like phosphatase (HAD superfamily)